MIVYESGKCCMDPESLITLLVERELGGDQTAQQLVSEFENSEREVFEFLAASGFGEREEILRFVAVEQGREFVDLDKTVMSRSLLSALDPDMLRIFECLPLEVSENKAKVCIADPFDVVAAEELASLLGKEVEVAVADPEKIRATLSRIASGEVRNDGTGMVAASLGHAPEGKSANQSSRHTRISSALLISLSVLAIAATASAALYLSQNRRLEEWATLVGKNEALFRESEASRKGAETAAIQMQSDLDALEKLLTKKEVDAIRIDVLEKDLRELRGKMDSLDQILAKVGELPTENGNATTEKPDSP